MISFISSIINVVIPDPKIFFWITSSVAAVAVNPNGIKTLLVDGLSVFSDKGNPIFSNGPKSVPKNPPDCPILCSWVFYSFILAVEPFSKALRSIEACVLINNNLCRNL